MIWLLCLGVWSFSLFDVGLSLPAGKNISLTKLFSIKLADLHDIQKNVKRNYEGLGIDARQDSSSLGQNVTLFRLHRPGFQHVDRSVALESNLHPGLYLRYKNYKFRMEKAKPTGLFEKDATFLERNPFGPNSIALELFTHPGWFMCHDTTKPFALKAVSKVVRSKEFDQKCVFRQNVLKVYGPKPNGESNQDKEQEEAKAAEILDSLVSKESIGEILAVKSTNKPAVVQGQVGAQTNRQPAKINLPQGSKNIGPALSQANKGLRNSQINSLNQGVSAIKGFYQPNQPVNSYNNAVARMKYINSLRRKGFSTKPFSQGSQNVYTGYRPRIAGKPLQGSRYGLSYTNTPHRLAQYTRTPSNYGNTWPRTRPPVYKGIDLQGGPGSMRPGKVLHMAQKPPAPVVQTSYSRFQNPLKNQVNRLPKASSTYNFINANKPQQYNARPQTGPISVALPKARPISSANKMTPPEIKPIVWGEPMSSQTSKPITKSGSAVLSGSGSGEIPVAKHREPKPIDPKRAVYGMGDKCISIRFFNKIQKPVKIVSSMKREGYLVTAETFKLKTIFKHARKDRKVHFYAQDLNDKEDVLLNNNNVVTVIPGPCDLPYRSIYLSRNGQYSNKDVEGFLKSEEEKESGLAQGKSGAVLRPNPQDGFSQWSDFGPCSTTCGTGLQTRNRVCMPGRACLGTTRESRACIHAPCSEPFCVQTYGGNVGSGKCCALPFIFQDTVYDKCITHANTGGMWCSTTPNYDQDKSWGFCKLTERRSNLFYRPHGYPAFSPVPRSASLSKIPTTCPKSCYNRCVPGCHVTCCSAHALAFPAVFTDRTTEQQRLLREQQSRRTYVLY
ncbi:uncharacterized protein LOC116301362 [Actinia tenebrosa]|uniref:Uncharacterized protein LOC116301362 n=1 Tax=Actinia tenebrosa TaxID=6105 RepID=A0A6P8IHG0_ACTTE|nr:uncharacterized protein LOC116301362 [Actinia tenebrosa]